MSFLSSGRQLLCATSALVLVAACPERGSGTGEPAPEHRARAAATALEDQSSERRAALAEVLAHEPTGAADKNATVTIGLQAEPAHLNPLLGADALTSRIALGDIYEGLLCQDRVDAEARPCLAEAVAVNADGTVWSFAIRRGVVWHDRTPMSADDVLFTYRLFTGVDPVVTTWLAAEFDDLVGIAKRDPGNAGQPTEVVMTFAGFRLGRRAAFARIPILPRHRLANLDAAGMLAAPDNRTPVGTGPLRFTGWTPGQEITLQRFSDYWGPRSARAAEIRYRIIPSRQRTLRALAAGRVDIATRVPADEAVAAAKETAALRVFAETSPSYLAAVYNLRRGPLGTAELRRALGLMMDRQSLAQALFAGYAHPISGPHLSGDPDRDDRIAPLPYDPAAARALLAQIPADDRAQERSPVRLAVLVPSESRTMRRLADIWADDVGAESAGGPGEEPGRPVRLDVELAPYAQVLSRLREGAFDIALMAFTTGLDLDLHGRFHTDASENYGALADPRLDRALDAVRAQPDAEARRTLQHAVQARLHELQPYTFIMSGSQVGLVRRDIGGFASASMGARGLWQAR